MADVTPLPPNCYSESYASRLALQLKDFSGTPQLLWLEVSIRKVLRPATSTQVFLGFPVSISKC